MTKDRTKNEKDYINFAYKYVSVPFECCAPGGQKGMSHFLGVVLQVFGAENQSHVF